MPDSVAVADVVDWAVAAHEARERQRQKRVQERNELLRAIAGSQDPTPSEPIVNRLQQRFRVPNELTSEEVEEGYDPKTQWRMADGTIINLVDMDDSHIEKAVAMLENRAKLLYAKQNSNTHSLNKLIRERTRRATEKAEAERKRIAAAKKAAKEAADRAYAEAYAKATNGDVSERPKSEGRKFRV